MTASFNHSQPIYQQIMEQFYQQICSGKIKPGEKLPSVREAAVEASVNPNTVQRTYMEMERRGIVETRRGQGTFVTENLEILQALREEMANQQIEGFILFMKELGFNESEVIEQVQTRLQKHREGV